MTVSSHLQEPVRTILVVDDEILIRFTVSTYLRECGFAVMEAHNADRAIAIIEDATNTIDLVFSDIGMPGSMDGIGLAKWLRANRPDLPIILTSSEGKRVSAVKELLKSEPFMVKPYDVERVVVEIGRAIDARKAL